LAEQGAELDVLIVEDSETDTKLVIRELRSHGFSPTWERVETDSALREALLRKDWHVVISDSSLPRLGALEALAATRELAPQVPFILVSGGTREELAVEAMRRGAADFMSKEHLARLGPAVARELAQADHRTGGSRSATAEGEAETRRVTLELHDRLGRALAALKVSLHAASRGKGAVRAKALAEATSLVDDAIARARDLPSGLPGAALAPDSAQGSVRPADRLTARQREVLKLVVQGHSTKEIARRLKISAKTVEAHRADIMDRLNIHNVAKLVHYAIGAKILGPAF
jgi:DNA-binding NarL/FixJ family response regulator